MGKIHRNDSGKRETMPTKGLGFVIIRHVNNKISDLYWKECYSAIRRFYPEHPIMIVDDSSHPRYLREDIHLTNCTVVYDTDHKGRGELLPYYYFHRLRPFHRAVVLHDSVFLQQPLNVEPNPSGEESTIQFLWSFGHQWDDGLRDKIHEVLHEFPETDREHLRSMYTHTKADWLGMFGVMSVVDWTWLNEIEQRFHFFQTLLPQLKNREYRCSLERIFALVAYYHQRGRVKKPLFGDIHQYMPWGGTYTEYLQKPEVYAAYPIVKVWSGR
jgi:hypothetical protein